MNYSQHTINENYIEARNMLEQWLNARVPEVVARLEAGHKIKEDGSLYKKDADGIRDILRTNLPEGKYLQAYIRTSPNGHLVLESKTNYKDSDTGCRYINRYEYLLAENREHVPYEVVTVDQYESEITRMKDLQNIARVATSQANKIKFEWDL